ncbi:MAG: alanine racemase [Candidatus Chloroheliales bacterium]|nr:MAG: alanine racemase [Chloroflexota bacterium]
MPNNKRTTITDVARAAGVSPTAVSFAFNNPEQLGAETTARIVAVAQELGYSPNPIARALLARRTGVIGILVPFTIAQSFANPFIAAFMQGVGEVCDEHSLGALIVSPLDGSLEQATRRAPVDGYIVLGLNENHSEVAPLLRRQMPLVIVDGDAETVSSVNVDDEAGAYAAAHHLLAKGHRDILIVTFQSPPADHASDVFYGVGGRRLAGYRRAFTNHGLPLRFDWLVQSLTSIEGGAAAFGVAWSAGLRPTSVLALSDAMALGVSLQANRLGLRIPQELEIIGFDDIPLAALVSPALSTVHQPIVEKGRIAANLLAEALESSRAAERVMLPTSLVLRDSTR